jgi:hypothetical protein
MSKTPAFLFYSQDFLTGCADLTMEERGMYITLLSLQHQKGHLTQKIVNLTIPNISQDVLRKFMTDIDGNIYNERLEIERRKRERYTESRRKNLYNSEDNLLPMYSHFEVPMLSHVDNHVESHMEKHMLPHMENENENENENAKRKRKSFIKPTEEDVLNYFIEKGYRIDVAKKAYLYYTEMNWHDSRGSPIRNWKGKMVAVWFKDENKVFNLKELNDEKNRYRHQNTTSSTRH